MTKRLTGSRTPSVKSEDPTATRALSLEDGAIMKSTSKRSSASHLPYVSGWWRPEDINLLELRTRPAKETAKNLYLSPHWQHALKLGTRPKVTTVESYGDNATSELQYGPRDFWIATKGVVSDL